MAAEVAGDGGSVCSSGSVSPACATSHRRRAVYWPTRAARLCMSAALCIPCKRSGFVSPASATSRCRPAVCWRAARLRVLSGRRGSSSEGQ